jgi:hypothetical protein
MKCDNKTILLILIIFIVVYMFYLDNGSSDSDDQSIEEPFISEHENDSYEYSDNDDVVEYFNPNDNANVEYNEEDNNSQDFNKNGGFANNIDNTFGSSDISCKVQKDNVEDKFNSELLLPGKKDGWGECAVDMVGARDLIKQDIGFPQPIISRKFNTSYDIRGDGVRNPKKNVTPWQNSTHDSGAQQNRGLEMTE